MNLVALRYSVLSFTFLCIYFQVAHSQSPIYISRGENINLEFNNFFLKHSNGDLWFSSSKDLIRFDGSSFKTIVIPDTKSGYIQGEIIEDKDGNIWTSAFRQIVKITNSGSVESFEFGANKTEFRIIASSPNNNSIFLSADSLILCLDPTTNKIIDTLALSLKGNNIAAKFNYEGELIELLANDPSKENSLKLCNVRESRCTTIETKSVLHNKDVNPIKIRVFENQFYLLYPNQFCVYSDGKLTSIEFPNNFIANDMLRYGNKLYFSSAISSILEFNLSDHKLAYSSYKIVNKINSIFAQGDYLFAVSQNKSIQAIPTKPDCVINRFKVNNVLQISDDLQSTYIITPDTIYITEKKSTIIIKNSIPNKYNIENLFFLKNHVIAFSRKNIFELSQDLKNRINTIVYNKPLSIIKNNNKLYLSNDSGIEELFIEEEIKIKEIRLHNSINFNDGIAEGVKMANGDLIFSRDGVELFCQKDNQLIPISSPFSSILSTHLSNYNNELIICANPGIYTLSENLKLKSFKSFNSLLLKQSFYKAISLKEGYLLVGEHGIYYNDNIENKITRLGQINNEDYNIFECNLFSPNDSIVWLSGKSDIISFNPKSLSKNSKISKLRLNEILINDKKYLEELTDSIVEINLKYNKNSFSVNASLTDFTFPNVSHINYELYKGMTLLQTSTRKSGSIINFPSVQPGQYVLKVKGYNSYNFPSKTITININIFPPIYERWWFILGMSALLVAIGWYLNYTQTQRKLKAQQIELDRQAAVHKTRELIARDLHDELGTELNKILFLSDEALFEKDEKEKLQLLDKISTLAGESIKNMREILWLLNTQNESLGKLTTRLRQTMFKNLKDHKIKLVSNLPPNHDDIMLSNDFMKNIHLICKEATNNTIKYAKADTVHFTITFKEPTLHINIKDNGVGISGVIRSDAYGLNNMRSRAEVLGATLDIKSEINQGVEINLVVDIQKTKVISQSKEN